MNLKRTIAGVFVIYILCITSILPGISATTSFLNTSHDTTSNIPESHLIEGVPYVGQTGPYCVFASFTSVFKYHGIDTSENEVLFVTGAGHSLAYPGHYRISPIFKFKKNIINRVPEPGYQLSMETDFICSLYGLSFEKWSPGLDSKLSTSEKWNQYWQRVKQNITNDIPVITAAHPGYLISFRRTINEITDISEKLFDLLCIIPSSHAIVILGFNESNQTVCFHDPDVALFGHPEYGNYVWMNLTNFSKAVEKGFAYPIWTFRRISDPKQKEDIFLEAHQRNIQRMIGNGSAYGKGLLYSDPASKFKGVLGIKALKELKRCFQPGFQYRFLTMYQYRANGVRGHFLKRAIERLLPEALAEYYSEMGIQYVIEGGQYHQIILDKQHVSQVLWNFSYLSPSIYREAELFDMDAENWTKLWEIYSQFIERGLIMTKIRGLLIIKDMEKILDNIIEIEKEIISLSS